MKVVWLKVSLATLLLAGCTQNIQPGMRSESEFPNSICLTNGLVVVVVAPECGRIVSYHMTGHPNLLWLNKSSKPDDTAVSAHEWLNYGGTRVWNLPEGEGRVVALKREWPPDETLDSPWTVLNQTPIRVVCQSAVSPYTGLQMRQDISLDNNSTKVTIRYTLKQTKNKTIYAHIWPITQVRLPQAVMLNYIEGYEDRIRMLHGQWDDKQIVRVPERHLVKFNWPPKTLTKIGTLGTSVHAIYSDCVFTQRVLCEPQANYADKVNCEVFVDPMQNMMELEVVSPAQYLSDGQELYFDVVWELK